MFRALFQAVELHRSEAALAAKRGLHVALIGAGGIHFGSPEGPWNHAARLEKIPGVSFSAVVDPNLALAQARIDKCRTGPAGELWKNTLALSSYKDLLKDGAVRPDAAFIGVPPVFHGSLHDPSARIELDLARAGIHFFVDKPLSVRPAEEVRQLAQELEAARKQKGLVMSVGYMLRYSPAVTAAKEILAQAGSPLAAIVARYACAYSEIRKREWWDVTQSGGPVVEQGTHFLDLMRFFGGEARHETVHGAALGPAFPLADLPAAPESEHLVPKDRRINRAHAATFLFESGALGSFTHTIVLHRAAFFTEIDIFADGLHMIITDPYADARLRVRYPHSEKYEEVVLDRTVDMYYEELSAFIKATQSRDTSQIRSPYSDAAKTYVLSQCVASSCQSNGSPFDNTLGRC